MLYYRNSKHFMSLTTEFSIVFELMITIDDDDV